MNTREIARRLELAADKASYPKEYEDADAIAKASLERLILSSALDASANIPSS